MERWILSELTGKILRARDVQGKGPIEYSRVVLNTPQWRHLRGHIPVSNEVANSPVAIAEVWQGGWVVQCPYCAGLEYGDPEEQLFLCCSCWNAHVGGKLLQVQYPAEVKAIETTLLKRRQGKMRGWLRHETLEDLRRENTELGVV